MIEVIKKSVVLIGFLGLASCASLETSEKYQVNPSIYEGTDELLAEKQKNDTDIDEKEDSSANFTRLKSMAELFNAGQEKAKVATTFSETQKVRFSVDAMKLTEFIHHVFRDILAVNYVVDNSLTSLTAPITVNFQNPIAKKQAFLAASEIFTAQQVGVSVKEGVYYLYPMETNSPADVSIGVGRNDNDLPLTQGTVLQIVPMNFGVKLGVERTLRQLSDITVGIDFAQSAVFLQGERKKVKKAMELARILDLPSNQGKHMGLLKLVYMSTSEFSQQVKKLMAGEGIPVGEVNAEQKNVVLVPLNQVGLVVAFASNEAFLQRIEFWHQQLDRPSEGVEKRYFMYEPQNARARDLGESLSPLFGGSTATAATAGKGNSSRDTRSALRSSTTVASSKAAGAGDSDISMVVDERTNTLIFYTTGKRYQQIRPLIMRMDTLPRQVILEATIAEVTLTGEFKHGVEFAVTNGKFGYGTKGAFSTTDIGGFGALFSKAGDHISANLIKKNSLVNILSSPTLLVRDGVSATITVGNEIPLVTSTTVVPIDGSANERTTTAIERRQIGLNLSVTPTINSQGIVIMEISIDIANQLPTGDGSTLLNRQVTTEVVANSGQTIILAGLISENKSNGDSKVPGLGEIPVVGNLFKSGIQNKDKTELVILVTPKIINDGNQWGEIKNKFRKGLENIEF